MSTADAPSDYQAKRPSVRYRSRGELLIRRTQRPERGEEVADLVVDLGRVGQRGRDLVAEQLAVAAAEPMGGDPAAPSVVPRRAATAA